MSAHVSRRAAWAVISCILAGAVVLGTTHAARYEIQLGGMRLGQHAVNVLDVYGLPDAIVSGSVGEEFPVGGAAAGGEMGQMGMEAGAEEAMMGGEEMAAIAPEEEAMGPGEFPAGEEVVGAEGAVGAAAAVAGVQRNPFPMWGLPLWVGFADVSGAPDVGADVSAEVEWLYRRDGALIGFVLDRAGYIKGIAVAGEKCDFARSALWAPHGYIKLGDSHKRVIYRYGWPAETLAYEGAGAVDWQVFDRQFTRDVVLRYQETGNIAFTIHNMKVVRMHIWASD